MVLELLHRTVPHYFPILAYRDAVKEARCFRLNPARYFSEDALAFLLRQGWLRAITSPVGESDWYQVFGGRICVYAAHAALPDFPLAEARFLNRSQTAWVTREERDASWQTPPAPAAPATV